MYVLNHEKVQHNSGQEAIPNAYNYDKYYSDNDISTVAKVIVNSCVNVNIHSYTLFNTDSYYQK